MTDNVRTPNSRVFLIEGRAGPANTPVYQGRTRALSPSWSFGDRTPVREPDPDRYGGFRIVDSIKGEADLPSLSLEARYQFQLSEYLRLARLGCPVDVQVHFGKCRDPRDFNGGWDKVKILEGADFSQWAAGDLGALDTGEDANVLETVDLAGLDMYEIKRLDVGALASTQIIMEVADIAVCDAVTCGDCGISSDGCSRIFAVQVATTGSPGLPAELIVSQDGGATIIERNITSLPANRNPVALACAGTRLVVVSADDCAVHYAPIADILTSTETWVRNAAGLTCVAGRPNDIFSQGAGLVWMVGDGGYVYFASDITGTWTTQSAGGATIQNLNAIHGYDESNLVAVGASNAVIFTRTGGAAWASVTGPIPGQILNTVWMRSANEWFVGAANGRLYYTRNSGVTWTEKTFSGSGAGAVHDIHFATPTVGYLSHATAAPAGRILRTIDGGASWYLLPEGGGTLPTNQKLNAVVGCAADPNVAYAGGLGAGTDGILVKAA